VYKGTAEDRPRPRDDRSLFLSEENKNSFTRITGVGRVEFARACVTSKPLERAPSLWTAVLTIPKTTAGPARDGGGGWWARGVGPVETTSAVGRTGGAQTHYA